MTGFHAIDVHDLLECVPPALAIWFDIFPLPPKHSLERQARSLARKSSSIPKPLWEPYHDFAKGALALYSLVPTALAVIATVLTFHNDIVSVLTIFAVIAVSAIILNLLGNRHYDDLVGKFRLPTAEGHRTRMFNIRYTEAISDGIRIVNVFLILIILIHGMIDSRAAEPVELSAYDRAGPANLIPLIASEALVLIVGAVLLLAGRQLLARLVGAFAIVGGVIFAGYLHIIAHDSAINDSGIAKIGHGSTGIEVQQEIERRMDGMVQQALSHLQIGPTSFHVRHLLRLGPFVSNESQVHQGMIDSLQLAVCNFISTQLVDGRREAPILLIVGAADSTPLGRRSKLIYGSNAGLAQSRAEAVKAHLQHLCVSANGSLTILTSINGPRTANTTATGADPGANDDRSVDVWAIWLQHDGIQAAR